MIWILEYTTHEKFRLNDQYADQQFTLVFKDKTKLKQHLADIKRSNSLNPDFPDCYKNIKLYSAEKINQINWRNYE